MQNKLRHTISIKKSNDEYTLLWTIKNLTDAPFIFKEGIALLDDNRKYAYPRFIPMNFTEGNGIAPKTEGIMLQDVLVKDKITNYRFWFNNYSRIGIEEHTSLRFWIPISQFKKVIKKLDELAEIYGLEKEIEQGLYVQMKDTNEEIDRVKSGNGIESIMSIEYHEGFTGDDDFTESDITQTVIR